LAAAEKVLSQGECQACLVCALIRCPRLIDIAWLGIHVGIHPTIIAQSFQKAAAKAVEYLTEMSTPVNLDDKENLLRAASTSLNSKIVSQYSSVLAPIAVQAVSRLVTPEASNVDLRDIRIVKKVGGTIDDTELIDGLALNQTVVSSAGGPNRIEKAKIGLIQFQLSSPKPDVGCQLAACKRYSTSG
jgi:T-complex protein 1 subunit delta